MNQLIFITAPWCSTCKQIKPLAQKICDDLEIKMRVIDMITDEAECAKYLPTSLPFLVFGDNAIAGGACNRASIMALVGQKTV